MRLNHNKIICIKLVHLLYLDFHIYELSQQTPSEMHGRVPVPQ